MNKKEFLLEYKKKLGVKNLKIVDQKVNNFGILGLKFY